MLLYRYMSFPTPWSALIANNSYIDGSPSIAPQWGGWRASMASRMGSIVLPVAVGTVVDSSRILHPAIQRLFSKPVKTSVRC